DADFTIDASITTSDAAGNAGTAAGAESYLVDIIAPVPTIMITSSITMSDIVTAAGAATTLPVTGVVGGDAAPGDGVTLVVNGTSYTGTVSATRTFNISVAGTDLLADADLTIQASVSSANVAGNTGVATGTWNYVTGTPTTPVTVLVPPAPLPAATPPATGGTTTGGTVLSPALSSALSSALPGVPLGGGTGPDATTAPSNLGGAAGTLGAVQGGGGASSLVAALNALPPTAAGSDGPQAQGQEQQLYVYRGVHDVVPAPDGSINYRVPGDAFAHTDGNAVIRLSATLADGSPLPAWMQFDNRTGEFAGKPPSPAAADVEVRLIARDDAGREASVVFRPVAPLAQSATLLPAQADAKLLPSGALSQQGDTFGLKVLPDAGAPFALAEPVGFPVARLSGADIPVAMRNMATGDEHRLFVFQGISSDRLVSDGAGLRIPSDAFAHTDPSAVVLLEARLSDGRPLPEWLSFDRIRGSFSGEPPRGLEGEIEIEVIARDADGREARTTFRFSAEAIREAAAAGLQAAKDGKLGLDVDAEEAEKARLEAARQAQQRATETRTAPKGGAGKPAPAGAPTFSEQLRGVQSARDPLLDRVANAGDSEKPPTP
ncbi:MAG: Ig-like domain-containing protein, partial [Betaproteobacteria bacterium]